MTSKERVKKVFRHEIPDKVPVFEQLVVSRVAAQILGRYAYTGGGEFAKDSLDALIEGKRDWLVRRSIEDTIELYQKLDMDIVPVGLVPKKGKIDSLPERVDEYTYRYIDPKDKSKSTLVRKFSPSSGEFFTVAEGSSCQKVEDLKSLEEELKENLEKEVVFNPSEWEAVDEVVQRLGKERAICISQAFAIPIQPAWLQAVLLKPEIVELHLDNALHWSLAYVEEAARHGIDFINGGGDLADKNGPVYSPKVFREMVLPRFQKLIERCHQLNLPYIFRTDGNIWQIADDLLVKSGADGFGEIQSTAGMDLVKLKEKFPNLVLWGNLDCGETLVNGPRERIEKEVKECFEKGKPGGNYIFGSSNSIHWGVPAENFLLMRETAEKYRSY
ncbi:MAG: uroporphyrinogen decarboxylase family protein [Candidatus Omnitrophota bacterium]